MSITRPINPGPGRPVRLPRHAPGLRIGLFGGTFNPPHEGHRLASLIALNRLQLDSVWWLVTPGNPLKRNDGLPDLGLRLAAARKVASHPRIVVTDLEATRHFYVDGLGWEPELHVAGEVLKIGRAHV